MESTQKQRKVVGFGLGWKSGKNGPATVPYSFPVFEGDEKHPQIVEAMQALKEYKKNK